MSQTFTIDGRMVGTNEYIDACRAHRQKGAMLKRNQQDYVLDALRRSDIEPVDGKVDVYITWYEPNARRDHDNVTFARKFILDALVEAGFLVDDGPNWVSDFRDHFEVDRSNPRIEVTLREVGDEA